ncbi:MAG: KEOPS complex subunit Pcc1 [Candidatus Micrarchaeia archaeon]
MKEKDGKNNKNSNTYNALIKVPKSSIDYNKVLGKMHEYKRSRINISKKDTFLLFEIEADDITALRASLNMLMRDISVVNDVSKL